MLWAPRGNAVRVFIILSSRPGVVSDPTKALGEFTHESIDP